MGKKLAAAHGKEISIMVADDHPVVREGICAFIRSQKDMKVVGEAANGVEAVQQFLRDRPDILLLDLRMPEMNGIQVIAAILEKMSAAKIIVLTTYSGNEDVFRAMHGGAKAYMLKDSPPKQLLQCIRDVHDGQVSISSTIGAQLVAHLQAPKLTNRESDVIRLMVAGNSNKEIGASLAITEGTVKVHVGRILNKMGARGRTEAIRMALERGMEHLGSD